ncbi:MAG TPA: 6,7-dimethyl-8-ribityllumazine synthase [Actinomycetota bacterium]|nr:6,7-dimethyl-8-ribityllumazine synthase [Actinomycetota bacterium]
MTEFQGPVDGTGRRVAVVAARFNEVVVRQLVEGARACLAKHGVADGDVDLAWTPGAFEIPLVARRLAGSGRYDAVVCLGAVIRGETAHFDFVAGEAARGIREASEATGVPCLLGVLTTENLDQALDRAGGKHGNKGWDAALAALEMAGLLEALPKRET